MPSLPAPHLTCFALQFIIMVHTKTLNDHHTTIIPKGIGKFRLFIMKDVSNTKNYFGFLRSNTCAIQPVQGKFSDFPGISTVFILLILSFLISCKKDSSESFAHQPKQWVTSKGQPTGPAITKTIGSLGGSVSSADGNMTLVIPADALSGDKEISIQKVSKTLMGAHGDFYRLTPHDIVFQKPVAISLRYDDDSTKGTAPELIRLVYQNQDGKWYHAAEPVLDKQAHTITASASHFSDWGYFPYLYIDPSEEVVDPNAQLDLRIMATVPDEYLEMPMPDNLPLNEPFQATASICGAWSYSGQGSISGNGNKAHYQQAPNSVPNGKKFDLATFQSILLKMWATDNRQDEPGSDPVLQHSNETIQKRFVRKKHLLKTVTEITARM